jgi:hypothetical protein
LDDVGGVLARGQPAVEAPGDHLAQAAAVALEEVAAGAAVAVGGLAQQFVGVRLLGVHDDPSIPTPARRAGKVTAVRDKFDRAARLVDAMIGRRERGGE